MPAPFRIVIPARYGSTRLPGKPLLPLAGRPMIAHVCERALEATPAVVVATDDQRIVDAVAGLPVKAMLTRSDHASGTERIAEVAERLGWSEEEAVVNLQGDEPLMTAALIGELAAVLHQGQATVATLAAPITAAAEVFDPNVVKTVLDRHGDALYFSRAPIPWYRDHFASEPELSPDCVWLRHIGIYGYTVGFLRRYVAWPASPLEAIEALEQLRILWHGERIRVIRVAAAPPAGVDTGADLRRVESLLQAAAEIRPDGSDGRQGECST